MYFTFTSAKKVLFSPVFVGLLAGLLKKITDQMFMKFYAVVGLNSGTNRLNFECPSLTQGQGQKNRNFFVNKTVQNCLNESPTKLKYSLFSKHLYNYGHTTDSFRDRLRLKFRGVKSQ